MAKLTKEEVIDFTIRAVYNFVSELLGTGALVFMGCMSCVLGLGDHEGVAAIAFGAGIVTGIEIGVHISGGYINPILVVAGIIFRKVSIPMGVVCILGEICGSLLGFGLVVGLTPKKLINVGQPAGLCTTVRHPSVSLVQALFVEFVTSSILVLVVCSQWDPRNHSFDTISIKVGIAVLGLAIASGVYSGGSMNPARSFGPAVWNNSWKDHWIYWVGPISAGIIWSLLYYMIFVRKNTKKDDEE